MPNDLTVQSGKKHLLSWLGKKIADELQVLLETKHLYQKVTINSNEIAAVGQKLYDRMIYITYANEFGDWLNAVVPKQELVISETNLSSANAFIAQSSDSLVVVLPHVAVFCTKCKRKEAFAPIWFSDAGIGIRAKPNTKVSLDRWFQMFLFVYQCQRCLGTPEGFLVRRDGWTLSLHGRSPMEHTEVPNYIPATESAHFRDAAIAHNSGKTLAGLFYLRTFIEQYGRRITGLTGKQTGDEIFDAYGKTLPAGIKPLMPSLKKVYEDLSAALHTATEDAKLFESAKAEIEEHFDMRRLHKIPEPQTVTGPAASAQVSKPSPKQVK